MNILKILLPNNNWQQPTEKFALRVDRVPQLNLMDNEYSIRLQQE